MNVVGIVDSPIKGSKGNKEFLLMEVIRLVGEFIDLEKIQVVDVPKEDELRIKMTILFNMQKIVAHVCKAIKDDNIEKRTI